MSARRRLPPILAAFFSMLVPGLGQLLAGARRRGLLLLGATAVLLVVVLAGTVWLPGIVSIDRRLVAGVLAVDLALLGLRLFAVLDAGRESRAPAARVALAVMLVATALPHVAFAYVTVRSYAVLETVFADEEPQDVLPARGLFLAAEPALPRWVPDDSWQLGLAEQLGPGETRPLVRSPEVLAGAAAARSGRGRRSCCSAPTRAPATGVRAPTRSSSSPPSTAPAAPPRSGSRATCRSSRSAAG